MDYDEILDKIMDLKDDINNLSFAVDDCQDKLNDIIDSLEKDDKGGD